MNLSQNNHKVTNWIEQLSDEDMPGFAGTVMGVTTAVNDQDTSAADVAQIILPLRVQSIKRADHS